MITLDDISLRDFLQELDYIIGIGKGSNINAEELKKIIVK